MSYVLTNLLYKHFISSNIILYLSLLYFCEQYGDQPDVFSDRQVAGIDVPCFEKV